jgi:hypothetical protein
MEDRADTDRGSIISRGVQRTRKGLASASAASKRAFRRVRGGGPPAAGVMPGLDGPTLEDGNPAGATDLADADVSVQRAWSHLRLTIAIIAAVAPVVVALISWRIKVWRASRSGEPIDL